MRRSSSQGDKRTTFDMCGCMCTHSRSLINRCWNLNWDVLSLNFHHLSSLDFFASERTHFANHRPEHCKVPCEPKGKSTQCALRAHCGPIDVFHFDCVAEMCVGDTERLRSVLCIQCMIVLSPARSHQSFAGSIMPHRKFKCALFAIDILTVCYVFVCRRIVIFVDANTWHCSAFQRFTHNTAPSTHTNCLRFPFAINTHAAISSVNHFACNRIWAGSSNVNGRRTVRVGAYAHIKTWLIPCGTHFMNYLMHNARVVNNEIISHNMKSLLDLLVFCSVCAMLNCSRRWMMERGRHSASAASSGYIRFAFKPDRNGDEWGGRARKVKLAFQSDTFPQSYP